MIKQFLKACIRAAIGLTSGKTVRVLAGPLKGRRLLRQHGLPNLSMLFGTYEESFTRTFSGQIKDCSVVYDIGANTGYFSLLAAHQTPSDSIVFAFEPAPGIMKELNAMVTANGLDGRIRTCEVAISDSVGCIKLFTPASDETGVIQTALRGREIPEEQAIDVDMSTLDQFVFAEGNPAPQVIKIDVEGAEASVLAGAMRVLKESRPTVLVEVHGHQAASEVWDVLQPTGYVIRLLQPAGELEISDRDFWMQKFEGSKWIIHHCVLTPRPAASVAA